MSLSDEQFFFAKDVAQLLIYIEFAGWKFTLGEVERPQEMQKIYIDQGRSWNPNSLHMDRLAIDINFFVPTENRYKWVGEFPDLHVVGMLGRFGGFWESLSEKNEWGGRWDPPDTPHFQRNRRKSMET